MKCSLCRDDEIIDEYDVIAAWQNCDSYHGDEEYIEADDDVGDNDDNDDGDDDDERDVIAAGKMVLTRHPVLGATAHHCQQTVQPNIYASSSFQF